MTVDTHAFGVSACLMLPLVVTKKNSALVCVSLVSTVICNDTVNSVGSVPWSYLNIGIVSATARGGFFVSLFLLPSLFVSVC